VRILIWERGVGPTLASGTGACAAAVAAAAFGGAGRDVEVAAPGGAQRVEWRDEGLFLTGWAELVLEGRWLLD
jgi:diaminopimelate epimerase